MHVGNLRTALYTWLIARQRGRHLHPPHRGYRPGPPGRGRDRRHLPHAWPSAASTTTKAPTSAAPWLPTSSPSAGTPTANTPSCSSRSGARLPLLLRKGREERRGCPASPTAADDPCRDLPPGGSPRPSVAAGEPYVIRQQHPPGGHHHLPRRHLRRHHGGEQHAGRPGAYRSATACPPTTSPTSSTTTSWASPMWSAAASTFPPRRSTTCSTRPSAGRSRPTSTAPPSCATAQHKMSKRHGDPEL